MNQEVCFCFFGGMNEKGNGYLRANAFKMGLVKER